MPKPVISEQNGQLQVTTKPKPSRNPEFERMRMALIEAFDENDHLRNRVVELECLLVESNNQNEIKQLKIEELQEILRDNRIEARIGHRSNGKVRRSISR